jgi:TolA-binding protein
VPRISDDDGGQRNCPPFFLEHPASTSREAGFGAAVIMTAERRDARSARRVAEERTQPMKRILLAGLCAGALCLFLHPGFAAAQDDSVTSREGITLQNQILAVQNQVQQLQAQLQQVQANGGGGNPAPAPANGGGGGDLVTQLLQRVSTLEDEVRTLTGNLQQLQNQVDTQNAQVNKQIGDITFQMQKGAGGAAGGAAAAAAAGAPPPPAAPTVVAPTPEELMQRGVIALHQGHYQESEGIAREILAKHRASPRAYDAQYLLAQSLQGEQRYQEAALAFDDAYNMNHKGSRAPNALLGLAMTLGSIDQKAAACDTLRTLHAQFPAPPHYLVAPIASAHHRLGC